VSEVEASEGNPDAIRRNAIVAAIAGGDLLRAHEIAIRGAASGDGGCMQALAFIAHTVGDFRAAETWYQKAIKVGDILSMGGLGLLYLVEDNPTRARYWFERAAESGDSDALFNPARSRGERVYGN